jgi:PAS domain S-box-containing protein
MILENVTTTALPDIHDQSDMSGSFDFKYLNVYANYLLHNKFDDFVKMQLAFSKEIKPPVLKFFEHFSQDQMIAVSKEPVRELLTGLSKNRADDYIKKTVEKWLNNQLPFITKGQIVSEDITLVSLIRRRLFRHFITSYTTDTNVILNILNEVDLFISTLDNACVKTFIEMHQQLFLQTQSLSHVGNWEWDLKTKKLFWSDELYRIYELEPQTSIPSEKIGAYNHPDDVDLVHKHMQLSIETLKPHDFFYRIILKDGRQKVLHAKGEVRLDKNGIATEMFGTLQDVTEQKEKEKELEESKRFAEKIADVSPCIITVYNVNTDNYLFINKGLQTLLGYETDEFYKNGRNFFYTLMHPDDINSLKEKIAAAIAAANTQTEQTGEQIAEFKYRLKHKDDSYKWIETFTTVFNRDSHNKVQDMLNVSIDITESHELNKELAAVNEKIKHNELQHQRMINEVEDYAILLMDKDGFIKNWNKGAEKIKGYAASEIIGKNFRIFYRKEDQDRNLPETLIAEAATKGKASHEGWRVRKDGTTFWGSIVITALHDDDNNLIGFTKVTRNLTERKIAEDRLRDYAHRIEKHNEELKRINKDLDSFTYMASHDLQEPLRKIKTFCNIILSKSAESLQANVSDYFERIITSVNRMQTLIDSLLNYSRATTSEISLRPVKLNLIVEDVKKELEEMIEEKQATIICDDLPVLTIERFQFNQLFFNLIENAIKYRRADVLPEIRISAEPFYKKDDEGNEIKFYRITISDNGIGFEQKYADNIFKLFQRLHGRNEYSGTGIGLAICKKIIENHKGIITAVSEPDEGSTFIIELPEKISLTENTDEF